MESTRSVVCYQSEGEGEYTLARDAILRGAQITYNGLCPLITYQSFGLDKKLSNPIGLLNFLEAPPGIGPGLRVLQTRALPLGHGAVSVPAYYTAKWRICQDLFAIFFKFFSSWPHGSCLSHDMTSNQEV